MDDEELWNSDPKVLQDSEWQKISNDFTNAGYREGITAGKESALQDGFDDGFASIGAPLGRELGLLRGTCAALISALTSDSDSVLLVRGARSTEEIVAELRDVAARLSEVRLSDVAPPDLEAIAHAREHLEENARPAGNEDMDLMDATDLNDDLKQKKDMEGLEDLMARMGAGAGASSAPERPTAEDVNRLKARLVAVAAALGLDVEWS
ncbi:uncharacterized protein BXZ73DRAFT_46587 [Epithele typhae]|uniref:uncharacterized protein n=1 Tax=Epithele typhae TaxID=378194 RepID=UPI002007DF0F|nr:uncharacterized protein BXZ73DRAFT_46587 [Epithele typhae]KAH9933140.1 hypothetical protein BXZ73DRAFT_46587 [Epithele typhae]